MMTMRTLCRRKRVTRVALFAAVAFLSSTQSARAAESLRYVLKPDFDRGVLDVELTWATGDRSQSGLGVAERVGPVSDVAALLKDLQIAGATFRRDGSTWRLSHRPGQEIRCTYVVDPRRKSIDQWDDRYLPITSPEFFHGLGSAFLLTPLTGRGFPDEFEVVLRWQLPAGYQAACSWGAGRHVGDLLRSEDLRQSVYLAGRLETKTVNSGKRSVSVAMVDRFGFTVDEFAKMTTAIIEQQCAFMAEEAFPDFVVTAVPAGPKLKEGEARLAGSGLYHSFALYVAPGSKLDDAVEHLFAHELFHYWNGRLLQARQPERLVYWFVEGFTDYYALRILYESEYWDAATYLKWLNRHLREYELNPARNATNEDIEKHYWDERNTIGEVPYQRGLLLGLRWHALAKKNGASSGLDGWFRSLVRRGQSGGFQVSNADLRSTGTESFGAWFPKEFDRYVRDAATIEVPGDALAPKLVGKPTAVFEFALGFDRAASLKSRKVSGLVRGSEADKAGLRNGDELLGWSVHGDSDRQISLTVQRADRRQKISYFPRGEKHIVMQFRVAGGD